MLFPGFAKAGWESMFGPCLQFGGLHLVRLLRESICVRVGHLRVSNSFDEPKSLFMSDLCCWEW